MSHINFEKFEKLGLELRANFFEIKPYPYLIIDNFLHLESYHLILDALPSPRNSEKSSDYIFAKNKFENPIFDLANPILFELREELMSDRFAIFLSDLYGKSVFIDKNFVGGGLHQGGEGSYLDMHADFSRHPVNRFWVRELNVLLYLNDKFEDDWGGHLDMCNSNTGEKDSVAPIGNRMVIMLTKDFTLHGYKKINFPVGQLRTSIASYAYSSDDDFVATPERSTLWRPENAGILKNIFSKYAPFVVSVKRSIFGSSTAKRANRDK